MKKQLFKLMALFVAALLIVGFTACSEDPEVDPVTEIVPPEPGPEDEENLFTVETTSVEATMVNFKVTTKGISKVHYLVDEGATLSATELLITTRGKELPNISDGDNSATISGFQANKEYAVHFAATTTKDEFFGEVRTVTFTTGNFAGEITFFDITKDSFSVHVNFPEDVKERGNVLKWGFADDLIFKGVNLYAEALNRHDKLGTYFDDSKTFVFDNSEESSYPKLEDGSYDYEAWLYEPIVPGQPLTFMVGEFEYVEKGELGYDYKDADGDWMYGDYTGGYHEPGWYHALFDYYGYTGSELFGGGPHDPKLQTNTLVSSPLAEEVFTDQHEYWSGYFRMFKFRTQAPDLLDGHIEIDDSGLKPNGGIIKLTPTENVAFYLAGIFTDETWEQFLNALPDRNPETIQWGLTSSMAFMSYGVVQLSGNTDLNPNDIWLYPDTDTRYRLVLIGMGDENGYTQFYQEHFYRLPKPTLPAPTIKVKAIDTPEGEESSPYELWFNVKSPSQSADLVLYACDTKFAWDKALVSSSYSDIIKQGHYFLEEEVLAVNSEEGMNIKFEGLQPGKTYGVGVLAINSEGTYSVASYAEATTAAEELPARVESDLFSALTGDWTISAEILYTIYNNETLESTVEREVRTTPVHIGDMTFNRDVVTQAIYDNFASSQRNRMTKEQVDAELASIESTFAAFNEQTRNYNRICCQGYDLYSIPPYYEYSSTAYISPETLFTAASKDRYTYVDAAGLLYDFGPKWYLEVDAQGNVTMPFNVATMDPTLGYSGLYIMGVNSTNLQAMEMIMRVNGQTGHFPVEISDDRNTMTIKPLEIDGEKYYPHCVGLDGSCLAFIQGDITLKRTGTSTASLKQRELKPAAHGNIQSRRLTGEQVTPKTKGRSLTSIEQMSL